MRQLLLVPIALTGCAGLPTDLQSALNARAACTDVTFWAGNDDETISLEWHSNGQVQEATDAATTTEHDFELPASGVQLELNTGRHLENPCLGVQDYEPVVKNARSAIAGSANMTIVPDPDSSYYPTGSGELTLSDIEFDDGTTLDSFSWEGMSVGWIPGG